MYSSVSNIIEPELCEELLDCWQRSNTKSLTTNMYGNKIKSRTEYSISDDRMKNKLKAITESKIFSKLKITKTISSFLLCYYEEGDFAKHQTKDLIIYLSLSDSKFEGGCTRLVDSALTLPRPNLGSGYIINELHEIMPITKGDNLILAIR